MKNEIIHFTIEQLVPRTVEDVLRQIETGLRPAAVISAYEATALRGDAAVFDGIPFHCAAFSRVNPSRLHALYV